MSTQTTTSAASFERSLGATSSSRFARAAMASCVSKPSGREQASRHVKLSIGARSSSARLEITDPDVRAAAIADRASSRVASIVLSHEIDTVSAGRRIEVKLCRTRRDAPVVLLDFILMALKLRDFEQSGERRVPTPAVGFVESVTRVAVGFAAGAFSFKALNMCTTSFLTLPFSIGTTFAFLGARQ
ncbi:hypothetical protein [Mesorhizobium sp. L103C105A0]|uniref:hypothetical protein n=1 Tax=Mesorhizobium sp. L103C105A0 TaxID=1287074 RepID=UPI001FD93DE6|nr:hypothetical protein [Mesorhizobium sp. L103C105A0]